MRTELCLSDSHLQAFQLGLLTESDLQQVVEHLQQCPVCRAEVERFDDSQDELLRILRTLTLPTR